MCTRKIYIICEMIKFALVSRKYSEATYHVNTQRSQAPIFYYINMDLRLSFDLTEMPLNSQWL